MISVPTEFTENRRRDTNRKSSSYFYPFLSICGANLQTSDFHIDLGHAEARAELGNPDAAAIRGLRDARSSCQRGRAEPRSLRTKPPARPGRDSYRGKVRNHPTSRQLRVVLTGSSETNKQVQPASTVTENIFSNQLLSSGTRY